MNGLTSYTDPDGAIEDGYLVRYRIRGSIVDLACGGGEPPAGSCWATPIAGGIRITWQDKSGIEVLRNRAGWITTPAAGQTTYDAAGGGLNDGWFIRRNNRTPRDEVCTVVP